MSYLDGLILEADEVEDRIIVSSKGFEWLRLGILCSNCFADLRSVGSFPDRCPLCGFQVREMQMSNLERKFIGRVELGSKLSLSDELARLGETRIPEDGR